MTLSGAIFIDRKNSKDAREAMKGAADQMQTMKQSVYMFPEGTRSYAKEPMLLPFKKGAFHLAIQAQVPIVPVVTANYSHVLYVKDFHFTSGKIPTKGTSMKGNTVCGSVVLTNATVLEPIQTTGLTAADVDDLCTKTREAMLKEIINLTYEARGKEAPIASSTVKATGVDLKQ